MIPVYVPQIIALAYIGTDALVVVSFLRLRRKLSGINLNLILFTKFRELAEFYSKGDTSAFMEKIASSGAGEITADSFAGSYSQLNSEIERLHRQFGLPYKLGQRPVEIRNIMLEASLLALLLTFCALFAGTSDSVLIALLFAILLNTVFYYPFISLYYDSVSDFNEAFRVQAGIKHDDA